MANNLAGNLEEFVVKLGVNLDTANMNKFLNFMDGGKLKAVALSGALIALTKVVFDFTKSTTQFEQSLVTLSQRQNKSIETTRAQENALKAMGKTVQDISRDKSLKEIYKYVVDTNKAMALPKMDGVLNTVKGLQKEFYALKSSVQYAMQWINYGILKELSGPIKDLQKMLAQVREWLQKNIKRLATRIGVVIGDLVRGFKTVLGVFKSVKSFFDMLPDSIKAAATAIGALWLTIKSGPIGMLIAAIGFIGDLKKDYENFQWLKAHPEEGAAWESENGPLVNPAMKPIWEAFSETTNADGTQKNIFDRIGSALSKAGGSLFNIGQAIQESLTNPETVEALTQAGQTMLDLLLDVGSFAGGLGTKLVGILYEAITGNSFEAALGNLSADNGIVKGGINSLLALFFGANPVTSLAVGLGTMITDSIAAWRENPDEYTPTTKLGQDLAEIWGVILDKAFGEVDSASGKRKGGIWQYLFGGTGIDENGDEYQIEGAFQKLFSEIQAWWNSPEAEDVKGAVASFFQNLFSGISNLWETYVKPLLDPLAGHIKLWFRKLWADVYNGLPDVIKGAINLAGLDPTFVYGEENEDGSVTLKSSNGSNGATVSADQYKSLEPYLNSASIGSDGKLSWRVKSAETEEAKGLMGTLYSLGLLGESSVVSDAQRGMDLTKMSEDQIAKRYAPLNNLSPAPRRIRPGAHYAQQHGGQGRRFGDDSGLNIAAMMESVRDVGNSLSDTPVAKIDADTKPAEKTIKDFIDKVEKTPVSIPTDLGDPTGGSDEAIGGRFDSPRNVTMAEDGPEYIIPVTKPQRAVGLVRSLLHELGGKYVNQILSGFGLDGGNDTIGGSLASLSGGLTGGMNLVQNIYNTNTVTAPVTIYVNGTGNPRDIGIAAYDAAERGLVRTLRGVMA